MTVWAGAIIFRRRSRRSQVQEPGAATAANRISALYHRAVELPFQERSAFLKDQCGDDEALREEIESLLQFDAASNEFLERTAGAGVINGPGLASSMMIGRRLGVYTLTAPIDSGGMGVVYRAS